MELMNAMNSAAAGMKAQGMRMRVISENLANADTTADSADANPYQRKTVSFKSQLDRANNVSQVTIDEIKRDQTPFRLKYDPGNPVADKNGYVKLPNVNPLIETMDMREAQRSYEANLGSIEMSRNMMLKTIDLLRSNR